MSGSSVPAVLDALVALAKTATGGTVIYGEPVRGNIGDFVAIGWNREQPAVVVDQSIADVALGAREEFDVLCDAVAWDGSTDLRPLAVRAYALFDQIAAAVKANFRLGGACMLAQPTSSAVSLAQTESGALATVSFSIHIRSQRT